MREVLSLLWWHVRPARIARVIRAQAGWWRAAWREQRGKPPVPTAVVGAQMAAQVGLVLYGSAHDPRTAQLGAQIAVALAARASDADADADLREHEQAGGPHAWR